MCDCGSTRSSPFPQLLSVQRSPPLIMERIAKCLDSVCHYVPSLLSNWILDMDYFEFEEADLYFERLLFEVPYILPDDCVLGA
uniref:Gamma-tubulin complex component n=1 Tax=Steinernema glaseri TaxID=37863 RepID=A0A1I7ZZG1_9BILA